MNGFWKRLLCLVLVCCLVSAVPISRAEEQGLPEDLYLTQIGNGTCTLCSAAMMVRSMMYINGNEAWPTVTQEALRMSAWLNGVGLKWNFKYTSESCVVHVAHQGVNGVSVDGLKAILDEHPEGIVLYCAKVPHAVYLSDYEGDVFYCAETVKGYSGKRIPLAESWMGEKYGSQEKLLENITAYWYVTAYEAKSEEPCTCREELAGTYKVTTETADLTIRAGHGTVYSVMGYIPAGSEILVTQVSGTGEEDWAHVTYNGISGYCSMKYLELVAPLHQYETEIHEPTCTEGGYTLHRCTHCDHTYSEAPTEALGHSFGDWIKNPAQGLELRNCIRCEASESRPLTYLGTVNGDYLRVRADAGTGYEVLGFLMTGDRVEILEQKKVDDVTWGRMETGWICMDYVDLDEITTEPPATEPPATEPLATEPPATEPPATEPPATEPPATEPPATEPPATEPPATEPPATEPPATEPPATEPPATEPEEKKQMGTVNGDYLRIRSGAGTGYEVLGFLMTGDRVEILEQKTVGAMSWGRTADGWISMTYVVMDQPALPPVTPPATEPPATEPPATEPEEKIAMGTVTGNYLRVRSGAGTGYEVVGFVMTGDRVEILEQKTVDGMTWGRIASGWISLDYVELDKPAEELPEQPRMATVDTDCLRVRSGAGLGHEIVGFLYRNAKVEILEETTVDGMTWGRTESGWISMDYVK